MKSGLLLIACLFSVSVQAQTPPPDPELGKLFLPPERRQALERQRQYNLRDTEAAESEILQLNGIVQRSSGYNSIWLNQHMQSERDAGVQVLRIGPSAAKIPPSKEISTQLKVGESINRGTRERKDVVAPGAIHVEKRH